MNGEPLEAALREVTDTKRLLEALLTSSESFDYVRAKATLDELRQKVKVLSRLQVNLMEQRMPMPERIIPFPIQNRIS